MSKEKDTSAPATAQTPAPETAAPSGFPALRKLLLLGAALVAVWLIFMQIVPRLLFPSPPPLEVTPAPESALPAEIPPSLAPASPPQEATPEDNAALRERIASLEETVQRLSERLSSMQSNGAEETLKQMEARLQRQEQQTQSFQQEMNESQRAAWNAVALWQAYDSLAEQMRANAPYAEALARFSSLAPENETIRQALEQIKPYADEGIVSLEFLRENFADIISTALQPAETAEAQTGIGREVARNLGSLFTLRKIGMQEGTTPEAVIARAEAALKEGDVAQAIKEIHALPPSSAQAFVAWEEHAQGYAARNSALDTLKSEVLRIAGKAQQAETR